MKAQQKIDKILAEVRGRVQEEVGSLLGVEFKLSDAFSQLQHKSDYLAEQTGKKIIARMDITGEVEGLGALIIGVKDAIRLGGTLIMLPQSELDEVSSSENYTEEIEDSYGEIANIIAGSYTKVFEEMYPKSCRFVRKEQEVVSPLKLDESGDEPFPVQYYYVVKTSMVLSGTEMGDLDMLIPALAFGFEVPTEEAPDRTSETAEESGAAADTGSNAQDNIEKTAVVDDPPDESSAQVEEDESAVADAGGSVDTAGLTGKELDKHSKLVGSLLSACNETISQEVGALLGVNVKLNDTEYKAITKEEFFLEEASGKQVLANMELVDGAEGNAYLFVSLKDAIRIGSILIMLPPTELESAVNEDDLSPDAEDAYGEIANIISGAYTSVFQEQYTEAIRFIKTSIEPVAPMKVDTDSDEVIPNQAYYLSSSTLSIDGNQYGKINMLIPLSILQLDSLVASSDVAVDDGVHPGDNEDSTESSLHLSGKTVEGGRKEPQANGTNHEDSGTYEILVIENDKAEAAKIVSELNRMGISNKSISFDDNIQYHLAAHLRLVIIVMRDVNEQSYGVTIKVNSHANVPIIAAGGEWTRTKVIKAVKYGVSDILLTPSETVEIREKIENNIVRLAA